MYYQEWELMAESYAYFQVAHKVLALVGKIQKNL